MSYVGEETYPSDVHLYFEEFPLSERITDTYSVKVIDEWDAWLSTIARTRRGIPSALSNVLDSSSTLSIEA